MQSQPNATPIRFVQSILLSTLMASSFALADEKHFDVESYNALSVSGSSDVTMVQGSAEGVVLTGKDDALDNMLVFVEGDELIIKPKNKWSLFSWWSNNDTVHATVNFKELNSIHTSGSSDLDAQRFNGDKLEISLNGSGDVDMANVTLNSMVVHIGGSADVKLQGTAQDQEVRINGSGDYAALDLATRNTTVAINGSGDVSVNTTGNLKIRINGSGDVSYKGNPQVDKRVNGIGDISSLGADEAKVKGSGEAVSAF